MVILWVFIDYQVEMCKFVSSFSNSQKITHLIFYTRLEKISKQNHPFSHITTSQFEILQVLQKIEWYLMNKLPITSDLLIKSHSCSTP